MDSPHTSVLPNEVLKAFAGKNCPIFVDGTLGAAGHARLLLEAHPEIELFIGIDQDPAALDLARERLEPWKEKTLLLRGNFGNLDKLLQRAQISKVDGLLLDIGVSSMQLDQPEKGFSFMRDGPLDMRMNPDNPLNAKIVINEYSEQELGRIFRDYGEEKQWRAAAKVLVEARSKKTIATTLQLSDLLMPLLGWKKNKGSQPLALIFQALRIYVNGELEQLTRALPLSIDYLASQGRLAVISFHSLEDRIVKDTFREAASDKHDTIGFGNGVFLDKIPEVKLITRRPVTATEEEIRKNPRSRSAKLRIIEKL